MRTHRARTRITGILLLGLAISLDLGAQAGRGASPADVLVRDVRAALAHGNVAAARAAADRARTMNAPDAQAVATALVAEFEGRAADARAALESETRRIATGDAGLELGLLDMREGRRVEGARLLNAFLTEPVPTSGEPGFRAARAARGVGEFLLSFQIFAHVLDAATTRPDIATENGDLLLQRHRYGDAAASYRAAIALDPSWIPAHLGLARALANDDGKASDDELAAAEKIAPDDPDVWLLAAEHQLFETKWDEAKQSLDRVAAARPGSFDEQALRAALAYGERRTADVEPAVQAALRILPGDADAYRAVGRQAATAYRFQDASVWAKRAVDLDGASAGAHADLGLYLLRIGDEKTAYAELTRAWDLDNSDPITKNLLTMMDTLATYVVVPSGPFIFKFPKDEAAVLKIYALPLADAAYKTYLDHYQFTPTGPILIEIFASHDDFAVRTVGLPGIAGALGACFGQVIGMDSPQARPTAPFSWQGTLWHEMAHVFTLQLSQYRVPRWLTEGISSYEEHLKQAPWGRELTLEFAHALNTGKILGVKGLPQAFMSSDRLAFAYFEASLVVEYLVDQSGDAGLRTLLKAYAGGADDTQAFTQAFGKNLDQVDADYRVWVGLKYGALSQAMGTPSYVGDDMEKLRAQADAQPGNYGAQLLYGQALYKEKDFEHAKVPLGRAAALVPEASGADSPRSLLAQMAVQDGDHETARKDLRELIAWDHANTTAARLLVALASEDKNLPDQEAGLRLITAVEPSDSHAHTEFGTLEAAEGHRDVALVEFEAALASGPANLAEAHTDLGEALLAVGRKDDAKREAFLALGTAPTYARAQDLLLAASKVGGEGR